MCRSVFGRGSVFGFMLPLGNTPNTEMSGTSKFASMGIESIRQFVEGKRFVIVEDDAMVSEALAKSLTVLGGKVECFFEAESALQQVNIILADYFIVDHMLSGKIDGTGFLLKLSQMMHRTVCAVMMSGNTTSDFIRDAEHFDWPVLHKPVSVEQLIFQLREQITKVD